MGSQTSMSHRAQALLVTCILLSVHLKKARRDFQLVCDWWREGERESIVFFPVPFGSVLMPKLKQPHREQRKLKKVN